PAAFTTSPTEGTDSERLRSYYAAHYGATRTRHGPLATAVESRSRHAPQSPEPEALPGHQRVGAGLCRLRLPLLADLPPSAGDWRACEEGRAGPPGGLREVARAGRGEPRRRGARQPHPPGSCGAALHGLQRAAMRLAGPVAALPDNRQRARRRY